MAASFTNWLKILVILIVLVIIFIVSVNFLSTDPIIQPLAYNHKIHIEDAAMECADCHRYVEKLASATLPDIQVCADCHSDEPTTDSPEEVKLLQYVEEGKEIDWQRIYEVPDHVYFSHRRHVVLGEVECADCHGVVEEQTRPVSYPEVEVTMDNCMDCHKENKVTNDCLSCHR